MNDTKPSWDDSNTGSRGGRTFTIFLSVACVALAVLVLLLSMQNRRLKGRLAAQVPAMPAEALKQGDTLGTLALLDESGNPVQLAFEGSESQTLLLIFSPDCPACAQTLPIWAEMLQEPPDALRVVAVRLSPQAEDAPFLPFRVYTLDQGGVEAMQKVPYIPATVLVGSGGNVEQIWFGVLDPPAREELQAVLTAAAG